jgi:deferrochelatase/peroxidase EfeB
MAQASERPGVSRRSVLKAAAGAAVVAAGAGAVLHRVTDDDGAARTPGPVPFHGPYQAGVREQAPANGVLAAFDVTAPDRRALTDLFRSLTVTARDLTQPADADDPGAGSLRITLSVGASLFDVRFGLEDRLPRHLTPMHRFPHDDLDPRRTHGDLLVAIGADRPEDVAAATRRLTAAASDGAVPRWLEQGFTAAVRDPAPGGAPGRNLLGFKDGTANPDPHDAAAMDTLVWVQPGDPEPPWTVAGTYQVVRTIRMSVAAWDQLAVADEERIIGRRKATGAPLGRTAETDQPDYADDPSGAVIPLSSHIRRANPRTQEALDHRILRRALSYSRGFGADGRVDEGLLFVCYQRDLDAGFVTVQARLNGEELERFVQPVGGGYFFVLPGVPSPDRFYADALLD